MKKSLFFSIFLLAIQATHAQPKDYKVVFDLTTRDTLHQKAVMRWINEISASVPDAKFEVVMYGQGLTLVEKGKSYMEQNVVQALTNKNVSFKVCAIALKNQHVDKSELINGVELVPDGIYEIITKQREGWGYIKVID